MIYRRNLRDKVEELKHEPKGLLSGRPLIKNVFVDPEHHSKYLVLNGTVTFKNSEGYLSAELQPYISVYFVFMTFYFALVCAMAYLMKVYKDSIIMFHKIILSLLVISFVQNFIGYIQF